MEAGMAAMTRLRIGDVIDANDYRRPVATVFGPPGTGREPGPRPHRIVTVSEGTEECTEHGCVRYDRGMWCVPVGDQGRDVGPMTFIAWDW
jgi:hypothetical protein